MTGIADERLIGIYIIKNGKNQANIFKKHAIRLKTKRLYAILYREDGKQITGEKCVNS
jgi:hypothetical protein